MGGTTPGRDWVTIDRQGVAPSLIFGLDSATRATFSYSRVENKDMPDQGFPFSNDAHPDLKRPNSHVDRRNFYGRRHVDFRDSWAKQATMLLEHDFDSGLHLRNITRQSETLNHYIMGRPTFSTTTVCAPGDLSAACDPNHPNAQFIKGWRARWRSTEALLLAGSRSLGYSPAQILWKVRLPAALPQYIEVDLGTLLGGASVHLADITLPKGVTYNAHGGDANPVLATALVKGGGAAAADEGEEQAAE